MRRDLSFNIYDDLKLDVYFEKEKDKNDLPILCYNFDGEEPLINEVIFLTDESVSMNTYLNNINKWYWAKELVINQIIRYLGNQVLYSYITSSSDNKLMDRFSSINAISWINQRQLQDGWNVNTGLENAHNDNIFNRDAALIIITDGSGEDCVSDNWLPSSDKLFRYYFFINFDQSDKPCKQQYNSIDYNFYWEYTQNETSIFDYIYISTKEETDAFIGRFFRRVHDRHFEQTKEGLPNTTYEIKHTRSDESIFITTDDSGMFKTDDLQQLPRDHDFQLGIQNLFNMVQVCLDYEQPDLPIPSDPSIPEIPESVDDTPYSKHQFVHFSSTIIGGEEVYGQVTPIYENTSWCNILGQGYYSFIESLLTNISDLNGIVISPYVRLIAYSDINFSGDLLVDITGPAILNNNKYNRTPFNDFHNDNFRSSKLQEIYPQNRRAWVRGMNDWKFGSIKIIFLEMPSSIYKLEPITVTPPPPTSIYPPSDNCRVHFSGKYLWDEEISQWTTQIYQEDEYSDYVGAGDYDDLLSVAPNSISHNINGICIDYNTRLIIYSKPNFEGDIILDETGPKLINNVYHKDHPNCPICDEFLTKTFEDTVMQNNYPPTSRSWSSMNMHEWGVGSCKILCTDYPAICEENKETINNPCLFVGLDISESMETVDVISNNNDCARRGLVDSIREDYELETAVAIGGSSITDCINFIVGCVDDIIDNDKNCELVNIIYFTDCQDGGTGHESSWDILNNKMTNQDFIINIYIIRVLGETQQNIQSNIDSYDQYVLLGNNKPIYINEYIFETISDYTTGETYTIDDALSSAVVLNYKCTCSDGSEIIISSRYAENINQAVALANQECGG